MISHHTYGIHSTYPLVGENVGKGSNVGNSYVGEDVGKGSNVGNSYVGEDVGISDVGWNEGERVPRARQLRQ